MAKRRKHGDGSIRLRKDGRWEGRVVIGYDEKGLPKTKNVLAKTKTECAAKLRALRERLTPPAPEVPKADLSLGNWLDHWYQDYKKATLRSNTQMSYERRIYQHIIPALGNIQLDKLTTGDIQQFYTHLKQNGRLLRKELYGTGLSDQTTDQQLPRIPFHGLRHTSATLLIASQQDVKTVSKRLGHAQTSTTMNIYAHALQESDRKAADALETLLKKRSQ